jgi:hypothetical protein
VVSSENVDEDDDDNDAIEERPHLLQQLKILLVALFVLAVEAAVVRWMIMFVESEDTVVLYYNIGGHRYGLEMMALVSEKGSNRVKASMFDKTIKFFRDVLCDVFFFPSVKAILIHSFWRG